MVGIAERVRHIVCATPLEAEIRELRMIGETKPRYNRRSRFPERVVWLKLTDEPFPRLSIVRDLKDDGATYLGPFGSSRTADDARTAIHEALPLRQCTERLSLDRPAQRLRAGRDRQVRRPLRGPRESHDDYARHVTAARHAMLVDGSSVFSAVEARMDRLSAEQRYEEAAVDRDRLAAYVRAAARMQRLTRPGRSIGQMVAASPGKEGAWDIHVIRHGRLAAAGVMPRGAHPVPYVEALVATAETVFPGPGPTPAASAEETETILRWLESPGSAWSASTRAGACPRWAPPGSRGASTGRTTREVPAQRERADRCDRLGPSERSTLWSPRSCTSRPTSTGSPRSPRRSPGSRASARSTRSPASST